MNQPTSFFPLFTKKTFTKATNPIRSSINHEGGGKNTRLCAFCPREMLLTRPRPKHNPEIQTYMRSMCTATESYTEERKEKVQGPTHPGSRGNR